MASIVSFRYHIDKRPATPQSFISIGLAGHGIRAVRSGGECVASLKSIITGDMRPRRDSSRGTNLRQANPVSKRQTSGQVMLPLIRLDGPPPS